MWGTIKVNRFLLVLILATVNTPEALSQLNRFKKARGGPSKFSLNPLKPLMKLVRDPLKASAQRHYAKYLPPPPGMFQQMSTVQTSPPRASLAMASVPWQRYYTSQPAKMVYPTTSSVSVMPPVTALPSSLIYSLANDRNTYRSHLSQPMGPIGLPSDLQIKTVRLPAKFRKPLTSSSLNLADSVVRQILEYPNQENMPSVLVIEDPDPVSQSSNNADLYSDSMSSQKSPTILLSPSLNGGDLSDSSSDMSLPSSAGGNPDVFVIVSKNSKNRGLSFLDDKKGDIVSSASSPPKFKKYKITSTLDDFGNTASRQVWIIKR